MKRVMTRLKDLANRLPLPKIEMTVPNMLWLRNRKLLIGASVVTLIIAGGLAWFIVRPMLMRPETAAPETQPVVAEKAEAPKEKASPEKPPEEKREKAGEDTKLALRCHRLNRSTSRRS